MLGLSTSDVHYLTVTTDSERKMIDAATSNDEKTDADATNCATKGLIDQVVSSYSGPLPDTVIEPTLTQVETIEVGNPKVASNQFVQVPSDGSLQALCSTQMQMVGTQISFVIGYTSTTQTITNQLTDMSQVPTIIDLQAAGNIDSTNLPILSIVQCPQLIQTTDIETPALVENTEENTAIIQNTEVQSISTVQPTVIQTTQVETPTTITDQLYVVAMTVNNEESGDIRNNEVKIKDISEPQRTSTPKPMDDNEKLVEHLNETILAGNLGECTMKDVKIIQEEKINREPEKKKKTYIPAAVKPCREIQLPTDAKHTTEKVHNETYCKNWMNNIGKVDLIDPNLSLAQGDSSVENTLTNESSLNITSISHNKPEYMDKENDRFVSQKNKTKSTSLQQSSHSDKPMW